MTPLGLFYIALLTAALGAIMFVLLSLYLVVSAFSRKVVWEDDATRWGKTKVYIEYLYSDANPRHLPRIAGRGFAIGFGVGFVGTLLLVGVVEVFL